MSDPGLAKRDNEASVADARTILPSRCERHGSELPLTAAERAYLFKKTDTTMS